MHLFRLWSAEERVGVHWSDYQKSLFISTFRFRWGIIIDFKKRKCSTAGFRDARRNVCGHKHLSNRSLLLWVTLDLSHQNQLHEALKVRGRKVSEKAQGPRPRECLRQQRVIKAALSIREQQYIQKEVSLYGCLLIGYCHNWIRITVSMKISYCSHRQHSSCDVRKKSHFFVGQKPTTFRISIRQVSLFLGGAETRNKRKIRYGLKKNIWPEAKTNAGTFVPATRCAQKWI